MARETLAGLQRRIAEIEGRPVLFEPGPAGLPAVKVGDPGQSFRPKRNGLLLPFGIAALDRRLGGGLRRNALHEIRGEARDASAATGFAAALLAGLTSTDDRAILWVVEAGSARETGLPHGPGLDRFGLDSKRLIMVTARRPDEALWVFEEGLRCAGLAAVLGEFRGHPRRLDLTASRRLALRARDGGVTGLLLRHSAAAEPGAALTRWHVTPLPAATVGDFAAGIGRPVWRLSLERNRLGTTGVFDLEWDHGKRIFVPAVPISAPLSLPGAAPPADRPRLPPAIGEVVALRRAS